MKRISKYLAGFAIGLLVMSIIKWYPFAVYLVGILVGAIGREIIRGIMNENKAKEK